AYGERGHGQAEIAHRQIEEHAGCHKIDGDTEQPEHHDVVANFHVPAKNDAPGDDLNHSDGVHDVVLLTRTTFVANGLRYIPQSTILLKNVESNDDRPRPQTNS